MAFWDVTLHSLHDMEAADFSKILVPFHQTTYYLIPKILNAVRTSYLTH